MMTRGAADRADSETRTDVLWWCMVAMDLLSLPTGRGDVPRVSSLGHHPLRRGWHRGVLCRARPQRLPRDAPDQ